MGTVFSALCDGGPLRWRPFAMADLCDGGPLRWRTGIVFSLGYTLLFPQKLITLLVIALNIQTDLLN